MAAAKLNLLIEQGASFRKTLTWKTGTVPTPVDLTGCTARMQLRESLSSTVVVLELTTENGGIVLGGTAGTIDLSATPVQTALITSRKAVYDLEVVYSGGAVRRLVQGSVTISPEVTR